MSLVQFCAARDQEEKNLSCARPPVDQRLFLLYSTECRWPGKSLLLPNPNSGYVSKHLDILYNYSVTGNFSIIKKT